MKEFVHLHVHTEFSLLDGLARIKKLVKTVKAQGARAVAITDHGNMYGAIKFYEECIQAGIKPIIGSEFYITHDMHSRSNKADTGHLILLAKNNTGYQNLLKLSSYAFTEGMYYKPRIDYNLLKEYSEGLICLSACLAGHVQTYILNRQYDEAEKHALWYKETFGEDFYLEIQNHFLPEDQEVIAKLAEMGEKLNIKLVATNDCHYINKEDAELQDVLMCVQMGKTFDDPDRMRFDTQEFYVKNYDQMLEVLPGFEEALDITTQIADKCEVILRTKSMGEVAELDDKYKLGQSENFIPLYQPSTGESAFEFLKRIAYEGLSRYYKEVTQELEDRMQMELKTIDSLGFVEYFLIVWDYINYARENDIPVGPGRGSGAGSLVAFTTGITQVDPMKYNLYFDRFINPERVSMPDFDIDFCMDRRGEVIDYTKRRYGEDHVSNIVTFGNMQAKNAIRDVARVLRYPLAEVDKIAKEIPDKPTKKPPVLEYYFGTTGKEEDSKYIIPELRKIYEDDDMIKKIVDMAIKLEGVPRNMSMHAAGVLISPDPVYTYVPLAKSGEDVVTQFDMTELEHLGLLKMDFLGLRTLTDIQKAIKYVKENHGVEIDFTKMEYDDPAVFELISTGNTEAVFQLESGGMKRFMKDLQPTCLDDIIAGISLYRPGPMDFIPKFIKGKKYPDQVTYEDPCLESILNVTYGCIVYQEQVMKIFQVMGGFTLGGADVVRRIMGKKKPHLLPPEKEKFINGGIDLKKGYEIPGAIKLGHKKEVSELVFDQMAKFAGYAFNKSHAAAYAYVSYQTGYLKAHYEAEYLTAVLNNRMANADLVKRYTNYARKEKIAVLPPDINKSGTEFKVENKNIRFGLGALKHVGTGVIDLIVAERDKNGEFKSFEDFVQRVDNSVLNKRVFESLIVSGAFDGFGVARSQLMAVYELLIERTIADKKRQSTGQFSLFDTFAEATKTLNKIEYPSIKEFNKETLLKYEKEYVGIYLSGHPLDEYMDKFDDFTFTADMLPQETESEFIEDIASESGSNADESVIEGADQVKDGQAVVCGGIVTAVKKIMTRSGNMAFLTMEDLYGNYDVLLFPKLYARYKDIAVEDGFLTIRGKVSLRPGKAPTIMAERMTPWNKREEQVADDKKVYLRFDTKDIDVYDRVKRIISSYPGKNQVVIKCNSSSSAFAFNAKVDINNYLENELIGVIGESNVIIK